MPEHKHEHWSDERYALDAPAWFTTVGEATAWASGWNAAVAAWAEEHKAHGKGLTVTADALPITFRIASENVERRWGDGWPRVGAEIRRALIAEEVLNILAGQDDEVSAERIRAILAEITS